MISKLISEIVNSFEHKILIDIPVFNALYSILCVKYLCDSEILNYDDVMKMDDLSSLEVYDENLKFNEKINYKKLIHDIQYEDLKEMIIEYANSNLEIYDHVSVSNKRKIVYIRSGYFVDYYYDLEGNTTYLIRGDHLAITHFFILFKLFDKVLNLSNDYKRIDEINYSDYEEMHYYGMLGRIGIRLNERAFEEINNFVKNGLRVVLYTFYVRINNYKNGKDTLDNLSKVIFLPKNKAVMIFEKKENDEISLINHIEDNNIEKLKKIIVSNRKIKDVLIKIKGDDIVDNNYRLGFRLYQLEHIERNKTINEIVDNNTELIRKLERINEVVEKEINFLINK